MTNFIQAQKQKKLSIKVTLIVFQPMYTRIITKRQKSLGRGSGWIIDPFIVHTISISKFNSLASSSYIKLTKELNHPENDLINIQNTDDYKCFKLCLVRYLNLAEHKPRRIANVDKDAKRLDLKT